MVICVYSLVIFLFIISLFYAYVWISASKRIWPVDELQDSDYVIVLGAGLERNGTPTDILSDRVLSAVRLIKSGKVHKMILSGSKSMHDYDETAAMLRLSEQSGIKRSQIEIDDKGNSTFESIVNFKHNLPGEDVIIVTQRFHLPRAIWLARSLGINAFGFAAQIYRFSRVKIFYWGMREFFALPFNVLKLLKHFYTIKDRTI